jgi:NAD(P)-dependent dehydrogenase (short-subunit alcohol dehydrogenase family)
MATRLEGKTAIVTGGGQGIGRGICVALAKEGADVVLVGRTAEKVERVRDEIIGDGGSALAFAADVSSRDGAGAAVDAAVDRFGGVDVLVNNAQDSVQRMLEDTTDDDVARAYTTGPLATLYMMQASLPYLKRRGGSVVNFGSSTALVGSETFASYAMAKEAIRGLTRVAAREWGPCGIRVNSLCPAAFSPSAEVWAEEHPKQFASVLRSIPLGRFGDPETDIGKAVVGLASDDLQYLTGGTLILEGGRVITQ